PGRSHDPADATPAGLFTSVVWASPRSLAATRGISLISSPRGSEMFQFPRLPLAWTEVQHERRRITGVAFPHSRIAVSVPARGYRVRVAVRHALPRLLAPRHPPTALCSLTDQAEALARTGEPVTPDAPGEIDIVP